MSVIGGDVDAAARRLLAGKLAAFATETVYGLGARAEFPAAVAAMYALKGRPPNHPSILHLADFSEAGRWAEIPAAAKKLAAALMPGALTLVLPAKSNFFGGQKTVAVRAPNHPQAQKLLQKTGGLFAPSANRFGKLSPTTAAHVRAEFPAADLYILDGGACALGIESAIAGCLDGRLFLLRPGAVSAAEIEAAAGIRLSPPPNLAAPGRLKIHYAPRKPLKIIAAAVPEHMAVLSRRRPKTTPPAWWRRAAESPQTYARRFYALLRELDETDAAAIGVELPPDLPEWAALRDRIFRAAGLPAGAPQKNGGGGGN